ncbi:MAG: endolytic transglycosylase MltG, partial [Pseudolabrys sp.]
EKDQPTPYNTYIVDGFPPCKKGKTRSASLESAPNPAPTKDHYIYAHGTGGHVFSETYEQHQKNVAKLRQIEQGGAADPAPAAAPAPAPPPAQAEATPPAASGPKLVPNPHRRTPPPKR